MTKGNNVADYFRPPTLQAALTIARRQPCRMLAGGTDFYPANSNASAWGIPAWGIPGLTHASQPATLDISAISSLRGIQQHDDRIEIGALTTWSEAIRADLPAWFDGVRLAGREVGGRQIQNRGTLVGNLCNASPAADGAPALMALDAQVRLQSAARQRQLSLPEFIQGNRQTALQTDELVTAIIIPRPAAATYSTFLKLGARTYLVISIVMVAMTLSLDNCMNIESAAIAVGACSSVARRLHALEQNLLGVAIATAWQQPRSEHFASLSPIDDIRASADYRRHSAQILVKRGLQQLAQRCLERTA